jgi:hypothetical protein
MANYDSTIDYFRVNATNTNIATSPSGNGSATEPILAPVAGGTFSSVTGAVVTGDSSSDFSAFAVNQYLYYTDTSGNYNLMGQIQSINAVSDQVTLYAAPIGTLPTAGQVLSASYALITNTEPIYMRISTLVVNGLVRMPDFTFWRTTSNATTGTNNIAITKLERVSNVGTPVSIASGSNLIDFTIQTMNNFTLGPQSGTTVRYFPTTNDYPAYVWIRITPAATNNSLTSKTMYRLTTQENIPYIQTGVLTALSVLTGAGYNITASNTTNTNSSNNGG